MQGKAHAATSTSRLHNRTASCEQLPDDDNSSGPRLLSLPNLMFKSSRNNQRKKKNAQMAAASAATGGGGSKDSSPPKKTPEELMRTYQELVDAKALVVFPIAFLLFNVGYWLHYLINN